jgi:hypothetical protein
MQGNAEIGLVLNEFDVHRAFTATLAVSEAAAHHIWRQASNFHEWRPNEEDQARLIRALGWAAGGSRQNQQVSVPRRARREAISLLETAQVIPRQSPVIRSLRHFVTRRWLNQAEQEAITTHGQAKLSRIGHDETDA